MEHKPLEFLYEQFTAYIEDRRRAPRDDVMTGLASATFPDGTLPPVHDVMRIAAGRAHMQCHARRLRETLERMPGEARVFREVYLGAAPASEVDRRTRERIVHRDDRRAIACDPPPVAERAVDGLAERDRGVLGSVMRTGLQIAAAVDDEIETAVKRELLEEVVVEPCSRFDAHPPCAVQPESHAQRRLGGGANVADGAGRSSVLARKYREQEIVVFTIAHGDPDPVRVTRTTQPRMRSRAAISAASGVGTKTKFACDGRGSNPRARSAAASRSRSSTTAVTSGGVRSAASASATDKVDTGAGAWRARSSEAVSRSASR